MTWSFRRLSQMCCLLACFLVGIETVTAALIDVKVDRVTLDSPTLVSAPTYTQVNFQQAYSQAPLVFLLADNIEAEPANVKVIEVTNTYFTVAVVQPAGESGQTTPNSINYWVVERGDHSEGDLRIYADDLTINNTLGKNIGSSTSFNESLSISGFATSPPVLAQIQTTNNHSATDFTLPLIPWVSESVSSVSSSASSVSFNIAMEAAESSVQPASAETIGYAVIQDQSNGSFTDTSGTTIFYKSFASPDSVGGGCSNVAFPGTAFSGSTQLVIANRRNRDGGDGGWTRMCSSSSSQASLRVDEDQIADSERSHTNEVLSVLAFSQPFVFDNGFKMEAGSASVSVSIGGGGSSLGFTSVNFSTPFSAVPNIFPMTTGSNDASAALRVKNVTSTGFEIAQIEAKPGPGAHASMVVDYIAAVPGIHTLDSGYSIEVGSETTSAYHSNASGVPSTGTASVSFSNSYVSDPALLVGIQTVNSEPAMDPSHPSEIFLAPGVNSMNSASAQIMLERGEVPAAETGGVVVPETLAWLAAPIGNTSFVAGDGNVIHSASVKSGNSITGFNTCSTVNYSNPAITAVPFVIANMNVLNGNNGGWLRRCSIGNSNAGFWIDEDAAQDAERTHTNEVIGMMAFSQAFEWCPAQVSLSVNVAVEDDGILPSQHKAISGAIMLHEVTLRNTGCIPLDNDTTSVLRVIPIEMKLFVGDFDGAATSSISPVGFEDGAAVSGLSLSFTSLNSLTDDIEFSTDGVDFNYQPTADANGYDESVTHIRINLSGQFNSLLGSGSDPEAILKYRLQIK